MSSILEIIKNTKQPKNGYLEVNKFKEVSFSDDLVISDSENIPISIVGIVIDYMTRFMITNDVRNSFRVSLSGAKTIDQSEKAEELIQKITGLNNESIVAACKLAGYDVCFRIHPDYYTPIEDINPDEQSIENIKNMVNRSLLFVKEYGPIIKDGFTLEGGYTNKITAGDGDYLTEGTIWCLKLGANGITIKDTLEILLTYLMGKHSNYSELRDVHCISFYNPRLNKVFSLNTSDIPKEVIDEVEKNIIGY